MTPSLSTTFANATPDWNVAFTLWMTGEDVVTLDQTKYVTTICYIVHHQRPINPVRLLAVTSAVKRQDHFSSIHTRSIYYDLQLWRFL